MAMTNLVPVTDDLLARAREDSALRRALLSEHLTQLMHAMGRAKAQDGKDAETTRQVQEGARLAVRLTEKFSMASTPSPRGSRSLLSARPR